MGAANCIWTVPRWHFGWYEHEWTANVTDASGRRGTRVDVRVECGRMRTQVGERYWREWTSGERVDECGQRWAFLEGDEGQVLVNTMTSFHGVFLQKRYMDGHAVLSRLPMSLEQSCPPMSWTCPLGPSGFRALIIKKSMNSKSETLIWFYV